MKFELNEYDRNVSDIELIADVQAAAKKMGKSTLTAKEYSEQGNYHSSTLTRRYGSWNKVLRIAGMKVNLNRNFTDEEMFEEIERVWILLGRQPTTTDIKKGYLHFRCKVMLVDLADGEQHCKRLLTILTKIFHKNKEVNSDIVKNSVKIINDKASVEKHKTNRDINLRLRFMVMQRDNFKCCACGASPAKDPAVQLQIDHIIPWSKGGETVIENLQTLCSKCNLGKSDIM